MFAYLRLSNLWRPRTKMEVSAWWEAEVSFCFNDLSFSESGVLKSPTIIVLGSMCVLSFSKFSFMIVGTLPFGS